MLKYLKAALESNEETADQAPEDQTEEDKQAELAEDQQVSDAAAEGAEAGTTEEAPDQDQEEATDTAQDEVQESADQVDAIAGETQEAAEGARDITRIAETVEKTEEAGGASEEVAAIAEVAIETIYRNLGVKRPGIYSAESFKSDETRLKATKLSVEDWKETAKKIQDMVVAFFQKIIETVKDFFSKLISVNARNKAAARKLADRIRKIGEKPIDAAEYKSVLATTSQGSFKTIKNHTLAVIHDTRQVFDVVENFSNAIGTWADRGGNEKTDLKKLVDIFMPAGAVASGDHVTVFMEHNNKGAQGRSFGSTVLSKQFVSICFNQPGIDNLNEAFNKLFSETIQNDAYAKAQSQSAQMQEFDSFDLLSLLSEIEGDNLGDRERDVLKTLTDTRAKIDKKLKANDDDKLNEILPAALSAVRQGVKFFTTAMVERAEAISRVVAFSLEAVVKLEGQKQVATESLAENAELPIESDGVNAEVVVTTDDEITEVQVETGVELDEDYKDYLRKHRAIDQGEDSVMGVAKGARLSVIQAHKDLSDDKTYPAAAVPLQDLGNESYSLYDNAYGRVIEWQPGKGVGKILAHRLESYIAPKLKSK